MDPDIMTRIENAQEHWRKAVIVDDQLFETVALLKDAKREIERQRKVLDWLLPQLFQRIYPEYDLGHPHMYTLITAVKQPDGGMPKDMWKTIQPFLDAKP